MTPTPENGRHDHGDILTEISDGIVALMKEHYGKGPTHTKTYYHDDLVVCLVHERQPARPRDDERAVRPCSSRREATRAAARAC